MLSREAQPRRHSEQRAPSVSVLLTSYFTSWRSLRTRVPTKLPSEAGVCVWSVLRKISSEKASVCVQQTRPKRRNFSSEESPCHPSQQDSTLSSAAPTIVTLSGAIRGPQKYFDFWGKEKPRSDMRSYDSNSPSVACFDASNGSPSGQQSNILFCRLAPVQKCCCTFLFYYNLHF